MNNALDAKKPIYIIGAGGFGREVAWLIERINKKQPTWEIKGFIDDNASIWGTTVGGYPVCGGCGYLEKLKCDYWITISVGNSKVRKMISDKISTFGFLHNAVLIDPSVEMSERVEIGKGSIICAGTIITTDIKIGDYCIINLDCTIGHDAILGDYTTLYPSVNVSGNVTIGTLTEVGTGSALIQGKTIGSGVIVGANSTIVRDVENEVTIVGSPARVIKRH